MNEAEQKTVLQVYLNRIERHQKRLGKLYRAISAFIAVVATYYLASYGLDTPIAEVPLNDKVFIVFLSSVCLFFLGAALKVKKDLKWTKISLKNYIKFNINQEF